jgi:3-hydroxyisobutyrate dehydrogenase-like beta-hydroxyacid dehydrogenase
MGGAFTRRLIAAGHQVAAWNRTRAALDDLRRTGGSRLRIANSSADAVAGARFVICALADGDAVRSVLLDDELLSALPAAAVVCDMGTSGVDAAQAVGEVFRQTGRAFVDAPVSGSVASVNTGQLLVMASGELDAVDAVRPVFAAFAKHVAYLGPAGAGQAMKLAVNLVGHSLNAALSEAIVLAGRAGVSAEDAYDVFQASVVAAPYVTYKREAFLNADSDVAMSLELVLKDMRLITAYADQLGMTIPAATAVAAEVAAACNAGYGDNDMAALSRFLRGELR